VVLAAAQAAAVIASTSTSFAERAEAALQAVARLFVERLNLPLGSIPDMERYLRMEWEATQTAASGEGSQSEAGPSGATSSSN
jgi:hypothetical protein